MRKNASLVVGVIVVIAVVVLGIMHFHKSNKPATASTTPASSSSTAAVNNAVLKTKTGSSQGAYLTTPSGQALYTFASDTSGTSNCTGSCLSAWPAYQDKGATTGLPSGVSTLKRSDNGETQFTYNGMPLYTFASDPSGQATGNGVSDFSLATPAAASSSSSSSSTSQPSSSSSSGLGY